MSVPIVMDSGAPPRSTELAARDILYDSPARAMEQTHELVLDGPQAPGDARRRPERRVWLLLVDQLPVRVFVDCGIVDGLRDVLGDRLAGVFLLDRASIRFWSGRVQGLSLIDADELSPTQVPLGERVVRRLDSELDSRAGFYPLAVRHSLRHGFHQGRWASGHRNWFLDPDRVGPLPRWDFLDAAMARRHFSARRYTPSALVGRMQADCDGLAVTNLQARASMPFLTAARRLGLPVVGYVASWDHTVGKGVVSPHLDRYVVQNGAMRDDLERYHGIDPRRVVVTGWPQADVYHRRRPRAEYDALVRRLGLDPAKPVCLYAGNTPTNAPYERNLVERLVAWWAASDAHERFSLLFRPHPRDSDARERFGAALTHPGAALQEASYTDLGDLATLLQHVGCLVANAGTILLEALVNDRPCVCVTFDEGAQPGERFAELNVGGEHYRELASSDALYRADGFDAMVAGIERSLAHPDELARERQRVVGEVVGEVDGRAVERVVDAVVGGLGVRPAE
jgi:CDP-Glycerol:Poly(glycerophosphate) glycerophosphotransferase